MGTPNSQHDKDPWDLVEARIFHRRDVQLAALEKTYRDTIRPSLPYLHGYKHLRDLDPVDDRPLVWDETQGKMVKDDTWSDFVSVSQRENMSGIQQVIQVVSAEMYCPEKWRGLHPNIRFAFFLTRKGKWLFWYAPLPYAHSTTVLYQHISLVDTTYEVWEMVEHLLPEGYIVDPSCGFSRSADEILVHMEEQLRDVLRATIRERERRASGMRARLFNADQRANATRST